MPDGSENKDVEVLKRKELELRKRWTPLTLLAGAEKFVDVSKDAHTGISFYVSCNREDDSTVMIPDLAKIGDGPVYITKPVTIRGNNLKLFLKSKGIFPDPEKEKDKKPSPLEKFIADANISCEAFYYTKDGPLLMVFQIELKEGLLTDLGGKQLGDLFEIHGASVRVLRCPNADAFKTLQEYCANLSE